MACHIAIRNTKGATEREERTSQADAATGDCDPDEPERHEIDAPGRDLRRIVSDDLTDPIEQALVVVGAAGFEPATAGV